MRLPRSAARRLASELTHAARRRTSVRRVLGGVRVLAPPPRALRTPRRARAHGESLQRYLGEGERVLLVTRQHPFALLRAAMEALGLLAPLLLAAWGIAGVELLRGPVGTWLVRASFVAMAWVVVGLAWRVLAWEFERVVVTGEKVIHLDGVLHRRIASTPLAKVSEFTVLQPLLGRVFDYGSLVVDVPGGREQALHGLAFLPDPAGLYRLISDQARRGRVQEGGGRMGAPTERDLDRVGELRLQAAAAAAAARSEPSATRDPWDRSLLGDGDHTIQLRIPSADA